MVEYLLRPAVRHRASLGNGKVTLEALPSSQAIRSESAHLVCLAAPGATTEKIGTTLDLPDRPNHPSETETSHIAIFHCGSGLSQGFYLVEGNALKLEGIGEMRETLLTSPPSAWCAQI